jgi:hypothetical protein
MKEPLDLDPSVRGLFKGQKDVSLLAEYLPGFGALDQREELRPVAIPLFVLKIGSILTAGVAASFMIGIAFEILYLVSIKLSNLIVQQ